MIEETNLQVYLSLSENKYGIYLIEKNNFQNLYQNEINLDKGYIDFDILTQFLDDNIFKIEKLLGKFIKNIYVIVEDDKSLKVNIGVKVKNYNEADNTDYLGNTLKETRDLFKKNNKDHKIMHMIVSNYIINGKKRAYFENDLVINEFCIEVNFISISEIFSFKIEKILGRYQIKINKYVSESYVKNFFKNTGIEFPVMICKVLNGYNENEVKLVPKNDENKGFFEKFFQFFS